MVIVTEFNGNQLEFTRYWPPLIYKHQECQFIVIDPTTKMWYPKDLDNIKVFKDRENLYLPLSGSPVLECPMTTIPTYRAMIVLQSKKSGKFTPENLEAKFYKVKGHGKPKLP